MSLNIHIDMNDEPIGTLSVMRREHADNGQTVRYEYHYTGSLGTSTGSIYHRPADGATRLAALALGEATRNLGRLI